MVLSEGAKSSSGERLKDEREWKMASVSFVTAASTAWHSTSIAELSWNASETVQLLHEARNRCCVGGMLISWWKWSQEWRRQIRRESTMRWQKKTLLCCCSIQQFFLLPKNARKLKNDAGMKFGLFAQCYYPDIYFGLRRNAFNDTEKKIVNESHSGSVINY